MQVVGHAVTMSRKSYLLIMIIKVTEYKGKQFKKIRNTTYQLKYTHYYNRDEKFKYILIK